VKRLAGSQVVVEIFYTREETFDFGGPRLRLGVAPGLLTLGHGESPIEEVADVGQDLRGDPDGVGGAEIGERLRGIAQRFGGTVGGGSYSVAEELANWIGGLGHVLGSFAEDKEIFTTECTEITGLEVGTALRRGVLQAVHRRADRSVRDTRKMLPLGGVDAHVVDQHGLGKCGCGIGRAGPTSAYGNVQDEEVGMVENPGACGGGSGSNGIGREGSVKGVVHVKTNRIWLPFNGIKVIGGGKVLACG